MDHLRRRCYQFVYCTSRVQIAINSYVAPLIKFTVYLAIALRHRGKVSLWLRASAASVFFFVSEKAPHFPETVKSLKLKKNFLSINNHKYISGLLIQSIPLSFSLTWSGWFMRNYAWLLHGGITSPVKSTLTEEDPKVLELLKRIWLLHRTPRHSEKLMILSRSVYIPYKCANLATSCGKKYEKHKCYYLKIS